MGEGDARRRQADERVDPDEGGKGQARERAEGRSGRGGGGQGGKREERDRERERESKARQIRFDSRLLKDGLVLLLALEVTDEPLGERVEVNRLRLGSERDRRGLIIVVGSVEFGGVLTKELVQHGAVGGRVLDLFARGRRLGVEVDGLDEASGGVGWGVLDGSHDGWMDGWVSE